MNRSFGFLFAANDPSEEVIFIGRTKADTKRLMIRYFVQNEDKLGMGLAEFSGRCAWLEETKVVFNRTLNPQHR